MKGGNQRIKQAAINYYFWGYFNYPLQPAGKLGKRKVISEELSGALIKMVGYRNRMVHFYSEVTSEELHQIILNNMEDFDRFNREISSFINRYESARKS